MDKFDLIHLPRSWQIDRERHQMSDFSDYLDPNQVTLEYRKVKMVTGIAAEFETIDLGDERLNQRS